MVGILDIGPEEKYGHADEHDVADAGPVRGGDTGGQPRREVIRRHVAAWEAAGDRNPSTGDAEKTPLGPGRACDAAAAGQAIRMAVVAAAAAERFCLSKTTRERPAVARRRPCGLVACMSAR